MRMYNTIKDEVSFCHVFLGTILFVWFEQNNENIGLVICFVNLYYNDPSPINIWLGAIINEVYKLTFIFN